MNLIIGKKKCTGGEEVVKGAWHIRRRHVHKSLPFSDLHSGHGKGQGCDITYELLPAWILTVLYYDTVNIRAGSSLGSTEAFWRCEGTRSFMFLGRKAFGKDLKHPVVLSIKSSTFLAPFNKEHYYTEVRKRWRAKSDLCSWSRARFDIGPSFLKFT